jgi:hypothetical protein
VAHRCVHEYEIVYSVVATPAGEPPHASIDMLQGLYLAGVIDGVALVAADANACPACLPVSDRVYVPTGLPPLPVPGCTAQGGCRCRYEPSFTVYE